MNQPSPSGKNSPSNQAEDVDTALIRSASMIILYFSFSLCLAIFTENMEAKANIYYLKQILELVFLVVLTFVQKNTIKDPRFPYKRLIAINFTVWVFGKILYFSYDTVRNGSPSFRGYALFLISQVIYHSGEFLFVVTCHPHLISWDSFLINHSMAYGIAQVVCHLEFWIEYYFFPSLKSHLIIIIPGLILTVIGQGLRQGAFISARSNFTHLIQNEKRDTHVLITTGVYKIARHPSYLGWFLSTAGGQLLLINPISFVGFTLAAWKFFYERIIYEEYTLLKFFGRPYLEYMEKTPIRIPFLQYFIDRARKRE